jgi:glycosyltransferase involved in cell wall biosynthesis
MQALLNPPALAPSATRRPRILYVSSSWPHDKTHGGQLRALHIGRALKQVGDVSLVVVNSDPVDESVRNKTAEEFTVLRSIRTRPSNARGLTVKLRRALDPKFLDIHGVTAPADDRAALLAQAREHDLVWIMNARTPSLLQTWRWPNAHLDVDDLPSAYLKMAAESAPSALARAKARLQSALLLRRERLFRRRFSGLSVCSEADRHYLGCPDAHVIPNGFARPAQEPQPVLRPGPPRLGFIGLYSYPPNLDGVRWFLREVWPQVEQAVPGVRFRLAGKDTVGPLQPSQSGVDALGWVADPAAEIATWSAMIVPLRLGGGTRIKLADAFSRKCPVVSTSFGAHGYEVRHGRQLLLGDTAADFAAHCIELLRNQERGRQLAECAWQDFLRHWTWDAIAPRVWSAAEASLRQLKPV